MDAHGHGPRLAGRRRSACPARLPPARTLRGGHAVLDYDSDLEDGPVRGRHLLPSVLQCQQAKTDARLEASGSVRIQQIYIDDSIFREAAVDLLPGDPGRIEPLGFQGVFEARLKSLAIDLLNEARAPSGGSDLKAESIAHRIATLILQRRYGPRRSEPRRRRLSGAELVRVADHMEERLDDTCGLDALAGVIGMNIFSFSRAFRETTGQTPHQYLIERRIEAIKGLLLCTDTPLSCIAGQTGFSSQAHMTTAFRKRVGRTPARWRALARA